MKKKQAALADHDTIITKLQKNEDDCGSTGVQIYYLTKHIEKMNLHYSKNKKDTSVKRSLEIAVSKRNKLCKYFKKRYSVEKYTEVVIGTIGLRK